MQSLSENVANNDAAQAKYDNGAKAKKPKTVRRRGRSISVSVTLSGEVAKWAKAQADANFRSLDMQVAYCVAQAMRNEDSSK